MEKDYSNYDMLDKLLTNSKKAKSWTILWITVLCLLAASLLLMANTISKKNMELEKINKELIIKDQTIQSKDEFLVVKNLLIDSLVANCNVAKTEIAKSYDSAIVQTENIIQSIVDKNPNTNRPVMITRREQNQLKEAGRDIQNVKENVQTANMEVKQPVTRLFIHYNNEKNSKQIETILEILKEESSYYVAPSEYVDKPYPTVIKFYNFKNVKEENFLKEIIAEQLGISPKSIAVIYETNPKIKSAIEIWVGTRYAAQK